MTFDGIVMAAVAAELRATLRGARVDSVYQPGKLDVLIVARGRGQNVPVIVSAEASCARVHVTHSGRRNPAAPPAFCMLLRKHLIGARIAEIDQCGLDRILKIGFTGPYDDPPKTLVVETMGRHSNIVLVDGATGLVLDSIKHVSSAVSRVRVVRPGVPYVPPPHQEKLDPLSASRDDFMEAFARFSLSSPDLSCEEFLGRAFVGIGRDSASTMVSRAVRCPGAQQGHEERAVSRQTRLGSFCPEAIERLWEEFSRTMGRVRARDFSPCAGLDRTASEVTWISVIGPPEPEYIRPREPDPVPRQSPPVEACRLERQVRDVASSGPLHASPRDEVLTYPTVGAMLDYVFTPRERAVTLASSSAEVSRVVATAIERLRRKLAAQEAEMAEAKNADEFRKIGELIAANAANIKRGSAKAEVVDYFDEGLRKVEVTLDPRLSPQENAQEYFKKYTRAKRRLATARDIVESTRAELEYLEQVATTIEQADTCDAVHEIRRELVEQGYIASPRREKPTPLRDRPTSGPLSFSLDEYEVLVGRNNLENDVLTLRMAHPDDIWMHARGIPGAHVVVRVGPKGPLVVPEGVLLRAAQIAAYYSKARAASKAAVDYTLRKHVKKPRGARPGMVVYDHERTIIAAPRLPTQPA